VKVAISIKLFELINTAESVKSHDNGDGMADREATIPSFEAFMLAHVHKFAVPDSIAAMCHWGEASHARSPSRVGS